MTRFFLPSVYLARFGKPSGGLLILCLLAGMLAAGCAPQLRTPQGPLDTPEHHYKVGMRAVDDGDMKAAADSFDLALSLDNEFGPAMAAKGLVLALSGGSEDEALDLIDDGLSDAEEGGERMEVLIVRTRANTALARSGKIDEEELYDRAKDDYTSMTLIEREYAPAAFYTGEAYMRAFRFGEAAAMFELVKELGGTLEERADQRWEMMQKALRAAPGTDIGKRIILVEEITRAEMAALLVEELNVRRFYSRTGVAEQAAFATPGMDDTAASHADAVDIEDSVFRNDIRTVLRFGVQGFELDNAGRFRPNSDLTRMELAVIFQDVLIRATGEQSLATKFIGQPSPFGDVSPSHPYFNAVMLTTTRGLFESDKRFGRFRPQGSVSGVDGLLYIRELKNELNPF